MPAADPDHRNLSIMGPRRIATSLNEWTFMNDVTKILDAIEKGDPQAASQLLPLIYDELRRLAAGKLSEEKPGQTLQATALVHEAYLRLVGKSDERRWDSRGHFFAAAAEAMRRILVETARRRSASSTAATWSVLRLTWPVYPRACPRRSCWP